MGEIGVKGVAKWVRSAAATAVALATGVACAGAARGAESDSAAPASAPADSRPADKSGYTLFNPVPANLMRDLSPDRPDVTESPYTVDAGHVQAELSFAEWGKGDGTDELSV